MLTLPNNLPRPRYLFSFSIFFTILLYFLLHLVLGHSEQCYEVFVTVTSYVTLISYTYIIQLVTVRIRQTLSIAEDDLARASVREYMLAVLLVVRPSVSSGSAGKHPAGNTTYSLCSSVLGKH